MGQTVGGERVQLAAAMNRFLAGTALFAVATVAGCVSSSSVGYEVVAELPEGFVGRAHRAWVEDSVVVVEVDQAPGLRVVEIDYEIRDDAIHLIPRRISGGGVGKELFGVDLSDQHLPAEWQTRVYWLVDEAYYPPGHSAFWDEEARRPTCRVRVEFVDPPGAENRSGGATERS
jgi:hypothetical protein